MNALEQLHNIKKYSYVYGPGKTGKTMLGNKLSMLLKTVVVERDCFKDTGLTLLDHDGEMYLFKEGYDKKAVQISEAIENRTVIQFRSLYQNICDTFNSDARVLILSNYPPPKDLPDYFQVLHVTKSIEN